jgi:TPR repeat protein
MLHKGEAGPQDDLAARQALSKACVGGRAEGCGELAELLEAGKGGTKEPSRARTAYGQGCDGGIAGACLGLGRLLANGTGGPTDADRAATALRKACDLGIAEACVTAGWTRFGAGDDKGAVVLLRQGCFPREGFPDRRSCFLLGLVLQYGSRDIPKALEAYHRGDTNGSAAACLGEAALVAATDLDAASRLAKGCLRSVEDACDSDGRECFVLAGWYSATNEPTLADRTRQRTTSALTASCDKGDEGACRLRKIGDAPGRH